MPGVADIPFWLSFNNPSNNVLIDQPLFKAWLLIDEIKLGSIPAAFLTRVKKTPLVACASAKAL